MCELRGKPSCRSYNLLTERVSLRAAGLSVKALVTVSRCIVVIHRKRFGGQHCYTRIGMVLVQGTTTVLLTIRTLNRFLLFFPVVTPIRRVGTAIAVLGRRLKVKQANHQRYLWLILTVLYPKQIQASGYLFTHCTAPRWNSESFVGPRNILEHGDDLDIGSSAPPITAILGPITSPTISKEFSLPSKVLLLRLSTCITSMV